MKHFALLILILCSSHVIAQPCKMGAPRAEAISALKAYNVRTLDASRIAVDSFRWGGTTGLLAMSFDSVTSSTRFLVFKAHGNRANFEAIRDDVRQTQHVDPAVISKDALSYGTDPSWHRMLSFNETTGVIMYNESKK